MEIVCVCVSLSPLVVGCGERAQDSCGQKDTPGCGWLVAPHTRDVLSQVDTGLVLQVLLHRQP